MGEPGWADRQVAEVAQAQADARAQARRMAEDAGRAKKPEGTITVPTFEPDPHQIKTQLALFPGAEADPANPLAVVPMPADGKKRAGRPPGAMNVASREWQEYLLSNYTSPLIGWARVSMMVPMELATALGCTLVEDTKVTHETLVREFGDEVAGLVAWVTKAYGGDHRISRDARLKLEYQRLIPAPKEAKTIKLADIYDNCKSLSERDPERAQVYLREKQSFVICLTDGDPELMRSCSDVFHRGLAA